MGRAAKKAATSFKRESVTLPHRLRLYVRNLYLFGTYPARLCDESKHCPECGFDHEFRTLLNAHRYCRWDGHSTKRDPKACDYDIVQTYTRITYMSQSTRKGIHACCIRYGLSESRARSLIKAQQRLCQHDFQVPYPSVPTLRCRKCWKGEA